jgi:hypothetical protein
LKGFVLDHYVVSVFKRESDTSAVRHLGSWDSWDRQKLTQITNLCKYICVFIFFFWQKHHHILNNINTHNLSNAALFTQISVFMIYKTIY